MPRPPIEPLSAEDALDLARARHSEQWRPVPGYESPEDHVGNSYARERHEGGWVFVPTTSGLDQDPQLVKHAMFYVVRDDGSAHSVAYEHGLDRAVSVLAVP